MAARQAHHAFEFLVERAIAAGPRLDDFNKRLVFLEQRFVDTGNTQEMSKEMLAFMKFSEEQMSEFYLQLRKQNQQQAFHHVIRIYQQLKESLQFFLTYSKGSSQIIEVLKASCNDLGLCARCQLERTRATRQQIKKITVVGQTRMIAIEQERQRLQLKEKQRFNMEQELKNDNLSFFLNEQSQDFKRKIQQVLKLRTAAMSRKCSRSSQQLLDVKELMDYLNLRFEEILILKEQRALRHAQAYKMPNMVDEMVGSMKDYFLQRTQHHLSQLFKKSYSCQESLVFARYRMLLNESSTQTEAKKDIINNLEAELDKAAIKIKQQRQRIILLEDENKTLERRRQALLEQHVSKIDDLQRNEQALKQFIKEELTLKDIKISYAKQDHAREVASLNDQLNTLRATIQTEMEQKYGNEISAKAQRIIQLQTEAGFMQATILEKQQLLKRLQNRRKQTTKKQNTKVVPDQPKAREYPTKHFQDKAINTISRYVMGAQEPPSHKKTWHELPSKSGRDFVGKSCRQFQTPSRPQEIKEARSIGVGPDLQSQKNSKESERVAQQMFSSVVHQEKKQPRKAVSIYISRKHTEIMQAAPISPPQNINNINLDGRAMRSSVESLIRRQKAASHQMTVIGVEGQIHYDKQLKSSKKLRKRGKVQFPNQGQQVRKQGQQTKANQEGRPFLKQQDMLNQQLKKDQKDNLEGQEQQEQPEQPDPYLQRIISKVRIKDQPRRTHTSVSRLRAVQPKSIDINCQPGRPTSYSRLMPRRQSIQLLTKNKQIFNRRDLDIFFLGTSEAYQFQRNLFRKSSGQVRAPQDGWAKRIALDLYNYLSALRTKDPTLYRAARSFFQFPFQTVAHHIPICDLTQGLTLEFLVRWLVLFRRLHSKCLKCGHLSQLMGRLGAVRGSFSLELDE